MGKVKTGKLHSKSKQLRWYVTKTDILVERVLVSENGRRRFKWKSPDGTFVDVTNTEKK